MNDLVLVRMGRILPPRMDVLEVPLKNSRPKDHSRPPVRSRGTRVTDRRVSDARVDTVLNTIEDFGSDPANIVHEGFNSGVLVESLVPDEPR